MTLGGGVKFSTVGRINRRVSHFQAGRELFAPRDHGESRASLVDLGHNCSVTVRVSFDHSRRRGHSVG